MEIPAADGESELVIKCLEDLIEFLGEAYANVQSFSAVCEQACEDYKDAVHFLRQLSIIQIVPQEHPDTPAQPRADLASEALRHAQSSLDALLNDAQTINAGLGKKVPSSHHASPTSRPRTGQSRVDPRVSGKGVHATGARHAHDRSVAPQHSTGETRHRAPVSGPASLSGACSSRALPLAPAGPKTVSKGGSFAPKTAPPPAPRGGSLCSDRTPVGVEKSGLGTPTSLAGTAVGVNERGALGANPSAQPGNTVRFPAFEALRFPASFRTALGRFHERAAGKSNVGSAVKAGESTFRGHINTGGCDLEVRKEDGFASRDVNTLAIRASEYARLRFLNRLHAHDGERSGAESPTGADDLAGSLGEPSFERSRHSDAVFTLLQAQLEILTGLGVDDVWRAVTPGDSHVARHRNRCLRALMGNPATSRDAAAPKPQTPAKPQTSSASTSQHAPTSRIRTSASGFNGRPIASTSDGTRQLVEGASGVNAPLCEDTWLPPICWTAVEISPEDLRQSATEVDVTPATGGAARVITCSSAKHLASLAHLTHSIESTVLRCYLEAVLLAPLLQPPSDRSNVTDSFLARCRLAYTLLCTEGRGSMSIAYRDSQ